MDKIKLLGSLILLTVLIGCTTYSSLEPIVEPIKIQHLGSVSEAVSKYRSLLINDGWKLEGSTSDGFLKAVKSYDKIMMYSVSLSLTVSCNQSSDKVNCVMAL